MKTTVEFLKHCGHDCAGEVKAVDTKRARGLVQTGYARIVETATTSASESADRQRPAPRGPRPERRG